MKLTPQILGMYLGCRVQITTDQAKFPAILHGVYQDTWEGKKRLDTVQVVAGDFWHYYHFEQCVPILRKLEDITLEEAAHCLQQTFFDHVTYPITDYRLERVGQDQRNPRISINNDWFKHSLTFGNSTGSIWSCEVRAEGVKISPKIFLFLLSKGFDLFNLIDDGSAIDSRKQ